MSSDLYTRDLDSFEPVARIVVIGVGGAGNNAVNRMIDENIQNVEFYVMNTDKQALSTSKAPNRIVLGGPETRGLGAGGDPEKGKEAAEYSAEEIKKVVKDADMVFIAAGMGKGTGTGASPVIARLAKEAGALTVAIVTRPFSFEGKERTTNAVKGLNDLIEQVDSLIIVSNDKLLYSSGNVPMDKAFKDSDSVLSKSVQTVADLVLLPGTVNLDFADVKSTLQNGGIALIGYGTGSGENAAIEAAESAINNSLLETSIAGARKVICMLTMGDKVTMYNTERCVRRINEAAGESIDVKFGFSTNPALGDSIICSVIASDFPKDSISLEGPTLAAPTSSAEVGYGVEDSVSKVVQQSIEEEEKTSDSNSNIAKGLLPNFLKGSLNLDDEEPETGHDDEDFGF